MAGRSRATPAATGYEGRGVGIIPSFLTESLLLSAGEWVPILEVGLEPALGWWCCIVDTAADIAGGDDEALDLWGGKGV